MVAKNTIFRLVTKKNVRAKNEKDILERPCLFAKLINAKYFNGYVQRKTQVCEINIL